MSPQQADERDERERARGGSVGGVVGDGVDRVSTPAAVLRTHVFDAADLRRALTRIAHEIVERNHGADDVVLVGLYTRGVALARRIATAIATFEAGRAGGRARSTSRSTATTSDSARSRRSARPRSPTSRARSSSSSTTCCSPGARPAPPSTRCTSSGGPRAVQLAVLVDRGHRELPLRADYVGKNLPTRATEDVRVRLAEVDGDDGVDLWGVRGREDERR